MNISAILTNLREQHGITQVELAEKLNINRSVLNRIELGTRPARDSEVIKIANFFNVSTDYLLGNDDTPPKVVPLIKENEFSEKEKERMRKIRQLAKHTQDYIDDTINREYAHQVEPPQPFKKVAM